MRAGGAETTATIREVRDLRSPHVLKLQDAWPPKNYPVVGRLYVEGCEGGDTLAVEFDWIDPWRYGFSGILPGIGPLGDH